MVGDLDEAGFGLARVAELGEQWVEAVSRYEQCLSAAADDEQYPHWLGATLGLIRCLARAEEVERAVHEATRAQELADEIGVSVSDVTVEINAILAAIWCERGEYDAAGRSIERALSVLPQISERDRLIAVYWRTSRQAYESGHVGRAMELAGRITDADTNDYGRTFGMLRAVYGGLLIRQAAPDPEKARTLLEGDDRDR